MTYNSKEEEVEAISKNTRPQSSFLLSIKFFSSIHSGHRGEKKKDKNRGEEE